MSANSWEAKNASETRPALAYFDFSTLEGPAVINAVSACPAMRLAPPPRNPLRLLFSFPRRSSLRSVLGFPFSPRRSAVGVRCDFPPSRCCCLEARDAMGINVCCGRSVDTQRSTHCMQVGGGPALVHYRGAHG